MEGMKILWPSSFTAYDDRGFCRNIFFIKNNVEV